MPFVQTTYTDRHPKAIEGMVADMRNWSGRTGIVETVAGIGFGRAVSQGVSDKGIVLGGPLVKFLGITHRDVTVQVSPILNPTPDIYPRYHNAGVLTQGPMWIKAMEAVAPTDPVYYDPIAGTFSKSKGAITVGTPVFVGTGGGSLTLASPAYGAKALPGTYRVRFEAAVAAGGRYVVYDPQDEAIGEGVVGVAFDNGYLRFNTADGTPDFAVGDTFTIPVTASSEGPIPGAKWDSTAAQNELALLLLAIQK